MHVFWHFLERRSSLIKGLALLWTSLILLACFIPGKDLPNALFFNFDKLVHLIFFGGFSLLWGLAYLTDKKAKRIFLWIFLASIALGILVELIQSSPLVVGRSGDVNDVIADAIGSLLAYGLTLLLRARHPSQKNARP